jgi:putative selenate reductase
VDQRSGFDLVQQTLTTEAARREAARCLQCSTYCDKCVEVCPNRANVVYEVSPQHIDLPRLIVRDGRLVADGNESFEILQGRQIVHVADFCNECGNCATFCVHQGKPYQDKPRLFLRREDFQRGQDNAFHIQGSILWRREGGRESSLTLTGDGLLYETDVVRVQFGPDWTIQELTPRQNTTGPISLVEAAEMAVLLQGIRATAPFLVG